MANYIKGFLAEFPRTGSFKTLSEAMKTLGSSKHTDKQGPNWSLQDEWNDPMVLELENLLSRDFGLAFRGAIKKIVEFGYTDEVAQWAVLTCGSFFGLEDTETNIVESALEYLKNEKESNAENPPMFEDWNSVVSFSMLEMVSVLREINPDLSIAEAIWYLLICNSNFEVLCGVDVDSMVEKMTLNNNNLNIQFGDVTFGAKTIKDTGQNPSGSRKIFSASTREMLKQKPLLFGKDNKGRRHKCHLKANVNTPINPVKISEEKMARLEASLKILEDHYAKIPFEESSKKHVPQDEILMLLLIKMKETENEKENWTKWANEKVKQADRRLGKDQKALTKLKADKEKAEKDLTGKKVNKEKTAKRMMELEGILANIQGSVDMTKTLTAKIEEENQVMKKLINNKIIEAAATCEEIKQSEIREQDLLKRLQEEEKIKNSFSEDLMKLRAHREGIESNLNKDKARFKQEVGRVAQIVKEKERVMKSVERTRSEIEQMIGAAKKHDEMAIKKSEDHKKALKKEIKRVEAQICDVKKKAEAKKIAEFRESINHMAAKASKRLPVFEDIYEEMKEKECVMCLNDEKSVVFLPCSHQVICVKCNELHEKKGMKQCLACQTTIIRRIPAVFLSWGNVKSFCFLEGEKTDGSVGVKVQFM